MPAIRDLLQGAENAVSSIPSDIGNAVQGAGNFIQNDIIHPVQQVFQPQPMQSPVPPPQMMQPNMIQAPPIQNFTDWLGQQAQNAEHAAGNAVQQGAQAVGNYFNPNNVGGANNPTPNFWNTPVAQGIGAVQQFDQNAPRFNFSQTLTQGIQNPVQRFVAQTALGLPENLLNTPSDILRAGSQLGTDYRTGQLAQPGTAIRDVAAAALPIANIATLGGGSVVKDIAENVGNQVGYDALGQAIKEGAITGAKYGGAFGIGQGLASSNDIPTQFVHAVQQGLIGAGMGTVLGGGTGGIANRAGAIREALSRTPEVDQQLRDAQGKWVAGQTPIKPKGMTGNQWQFQLEFNQKYGRNPYTPVMTSDLANSINYEMGKSGIGLSIRDVNQDKNPLGDTNQQQPQAPTVPQEGMSPEATSQPIAQQVQELQNTVSQKQSENQAKAQLAQQARSQYSPSQLQDIAQLKRLYGTSKAFQEGDVESIRASQHAPLLNRVLESVRENTPITDDSEALQSALTVPTKADTTVSRVPEMQQLREAQARYKAEQQQFEKDFGRPATPAEQQQMVKDSTQGMFSKLGATKELPDDLLKQRMDMEASMEDPGNKVYNLEPSLKEQLTQPPLPPKMSQKAIVEGAETPRTGRDISVSPQATVRFRVKGEQPVTIGNSEPLPWETEPAGNWEGREAAGLPEDPTTPNIKISSKENPVKITDPNATVQDARRAMDTAQTQIQTRGRVVQQLVNQAIDQGDKTGAENTPTNYGENRLFRQAIEHPEQEASILRQVKNPIKFKQALDAFREFTQFNLKASQDAGSKLQGIKNYYSHQWDLSDPADQERFNQIMEAKAKNYKGWFNKQRVFNSIEEGEAKDFKLKNSSVANDVADYTNAFSKEQGARVLSNKLVANFPTKAVIVDGEGAPANFKQSDIPGAKGLYTSQDIKDQLRDLEPQQESKFVKVVAGVNNIDKEIKLSGGLFHIQNTGMDYIASNLGLGRFPRLATAAKVFLSPGSYVDYMKGVISDGTLDKMAQANISLDTEQDLTVKGGVQKVTQGINKFNPFEQLNKATFGRLMNFFKIEAFKALDGRGFIDTSTPEGLKNAQGYGREINNMFGGQNRIVGDDIFKTQTSRVLSHLGILAPDYQQGRFKRTLSAIGIGDGSGANPLKRNSANNYAAYTLALRIGLTAAVTELARRAITGKFSPNLISAVQNNVFDPNFPTPWTNTSASGTKEKEVAHLPASNVSDIVKAVQDPSHFIISHTGGALSDYVSYAANQDYYGNKLSQTNNPAEKGIKVALNDAPIPVVQGQKLLNGTVSPGNALLNELGARVSLDPNDPSALYYKGQSTAMQNLLSQTPDPKMQNALTAGLQQVQSVSALNPNDPRRKQVEYTTYAAFPQLFQVQQQASLAQAGGDPSKADPLYTSPYAKEYIEYEQISSSAPGSSEEKDYLNQHPELLPLLSARAAFYQANPISQNPNAPAYIPPPQPSAYVQQQLTAKNYTDPQVQSYLTAHGQFINNQRQTIGLPMLNTFGQNPMEAAKSNASYQRNQAMSMIRKIKYINKEGNYQLKKAKEKENAVNGNYARIRSRTTHSSPSRKIASAPLQATPYRVVAPPTLKRAGYKAAFKVPANIRLTA